MEGFLRYDFQELIFGGAYFRNFMVFYFEICSNSDIMLDLIPKRSGCSTKI